MTCLCGYKSMWTKQSWSLAIFWSRCLITLIIISKSILGHISKEQTSHFLFGNGTEIISSLKDDPAYNCEANDQLVERRIWVKLIERSFNVETTENGDRPIHVLIQVDVAQYFYIKEIRIAVRFICVSIPLSRFI